MSNAETILEFLDERFSTGVCDDCISRETRVEPRQQVNQICRQLEQRRTIARYIERCAVCGHTKRVNIIRRGASATEVATPAKAPQAAGEVSTVYQVAAVSIEALWKHLDRFCRLSSTNTRFRTERTGSPPSSRH
jgi:hypothetical protein